MNRGWTECGGCKVESPRKSMAFEGDDKKLYCVECAVEYIKSLSCQACAQLEGHCDDCNERLYQDQYARYKENPEEYEHNRNQQSGD